MIIKKNQSLWEMLLPDYGRPARHIAKFFDTISALMSRHLCSFIYTFFSEIEDYLRQYAAGNVFSPTQDGYNPGFPETPDSWGRPLVKVQVLWGGGVPQYPY